MWWRAIIAGLIVAGVSEISGRFPRLGALLLTLPVVSLIAFIATWHKNQDLQSISTLARETLILVPLGLPFFIPLAMASQWKLGFWPAFALGIVLASMTIGLWFWFGPQDSR